MSKLISCQGFSNRKQLIFFPKLVTYNNTQIPLKHSIILQGKKPNIIGLFPHKDLHGIIPMTPYEENILFK